VESWKYPYRRRVVGFRFRGVVFRLWRRLLLICKGFYGEDIGWVFCGCGFVLRGGGKRGTGFGANHVDPSEFALS